MIVTMRCSGLRLWGLLQPRVGMALQDVHEGEIAVFCFVARGLRGVCVNEAFLFAKPDRTRVS